MINSNNDDNLLKVRKQIRSLSEEEVNDLRHAFEQLYLVSEQGGVNDERGYQWIAGVHGLPIPIYCQHGSLNFPTWHRAYIYEFEQRLQDQVESVMLPYWDWTSEESIEEGIPRICTEQTYVDLDTGETKPNPLYSAYSQITSLNTSRSPQAPSQLRRLKLGVDLAMRQQTYDRFAMALEQPHNGLHVWVGGDMGSVPSAAYDPIFWFHHCNVDKQWAEWQRKHTVETAPTEVREFVCAPFSYTGGETLDTRFLGYSYVESGTVAVSAASLSAASMTDDDSGIIKRQFYYKQQPFKHAFLELQGVARTARTYQLVIYLGALPNNIETLPAMTSNEGSLYLFGHGQCTGGQKHCQVKTKKRFFDHRADSHVQPYDTFVDVTHLLEVYQGSTDPLELFIVVYDDQGKRTDSKEIIFKRMTLVTHI